MRDNMGLYHAKRTYNGKWVEGCLVVTPQGDAYIISTAETKRDVNVLINQCSLNVDPETVGQYTGLTDKNGKRIFEGDILQGEQYPFKSNGKYNYFVEVCYWDNAPEFGIYTFKNPKADIRGVSEGNTDDMQDWESSDWEIIGNIHDNPELLGKEDT